MKSELPRWRLSLLAARRKPTTIKNYCRSVEQFEDFLAARDMPTDTAIITRDHIRAWSVWLSDEMKQAPSTVALRWKSLSVFFRWAEDEGIIERNPFDRLKTPAVPEPYKAVLTLDEIRLLIRAADGRSFTAKRNVAAIYFLYDTGCRIGEFVGIQMADVDLTTSTVVLRNSKTRPRVVRLGPAAAVALGRYLRLRERYPQRGRSSLWLSRRGAWSDSGCRDMFQRLQVRTGINVHPHALRHAHVHSVLSSNVPRDVVMYAMGWRSMKMLTSVYATSLAGERAVAAMVGHSPADTL